MPLLINVEIFAFNAAVMLCPSINTFKISVCSRNPIQWNICGAFFRFQPNPYQYAESPSFECTAQSAPHTITGFLSRGSSGCKQVYFAGIPLIIEPPPTTEKPPAGKKKGISLTSRTVKVCEPSVPVSVLNHLRYRSCRRILAYTTVAYSWVVESFQLITARSTLSYW